MTSPRLPSVLILLGGMVLTVALAPLLVHLLREQLHVNCGYATVGEPTGSWMCADGISYIFPGLGILLGSLLALLVAMLTVPAAPRVTAAVARVLAPLPMLWVGLATGSTVLRTDPLPQGSTSVGLWAEGIAGAALVSALGAVLLGTANAVATHRRADPATGSRLRARRVAVVTSAAVGAALLVAGGLWRPGLMHAVAASAALVAVAWIAGTAPRTAAPLAWRNGRPPRRAL